MRSSETYTGQRKCCAKINFIKISNTGIGELNYIYIYIYNTGRTQQLTEKKVTKPVKYLHTQAHENMYTVLAISHFLHYINSHVSS